MKRLIKFEKIVTKILLGIIAFCFLCIVILIITLVMLRYGFNSTIVGANEFVVILFIYTSAIGAAVVLGKKEHIAITYFIDKLPPLTRKIVDAFNYLLIAVLNGAMIWYSFHWINITGSYLTAVLQIKQFYAQIIIPVGCGITILYCFYHILNIFSSAKTERLP